MATAMPVLQVGSCPVPSHGEHWACVQGKAYVCILCSFYNSFSYLYVCVAVCACRNLCALHVCRCPGARKWWFRATRRVLGTECDHLPEQ